MRPRRAGAARPARGSFARGSLAGRSLAGHLVVGLTAALACLAVAPSASAHGRPPVVSDVTFVPGAPNRVVARGTWGLALSDDGGASWTWICAAAYGVDATFEDPDVLALPDGSVLLGTFGGLWRSRIDRCEWSEPDPDLDGVYVIDLDARPTAPEVVYAVETSGGAPDQLHVSRDAGRSFDPVGPPLEDLLVERVRVAPSDPARVYLSGAQPVDADNPTRRGWLLRSDDAGERFTRVEVPLTDEEKNVHLLAVDPTDPDRLVLRVTRRPLDARPERLLLSTDGGATLRPVLEAQSFSGAVFAEDGGTLWVSARRGENADDGPPVGLWRSEDGGETFTRQNGRDLPCVARRGDEIWTCVDELADGHSLARSDDRGASFDVTLTFDQLGALPACDACSNVGFTCPAWFPDLAFDLGLDGGAATLPDGSVTGGPRDAAPPTRCGDGSPILDAGPGGGGDAGCGCRVGAPLELPAWPGLALLALARVTTRRRRALERRR